MKICYNYLLHRRQIFKYITSHSTIILVFVYFLRILSRFYVNGYELLWDRMIPMIHNKQNLLETKKNHGHFIFFSNMVSPKAVLK
jgi:hypothetical protein